MNMPASAPCCGRFTSRRGFTFLEVIVSAAMLAVLLSIVGQMLVQVRRHARKAEHQAFALQTVENCLEELTNLPWAEVTDGRIAAFELPEALRQRWPQAKLTGSVTESAEPVESKRISLRLALAPEAPGRSMALTTWIYRSHNENE